MLYDIDNIFYFLSKEEKDKLKEKYKDTQLSKDEVIKEICKDYSLDYDKTIRRNKLDKDITNISTMIANFIRDIIKIFRKVTSSRKLESVLETIVKIIIFIVVIMLFKIPFILVEYLIKYLCNMLFYPFDYSIKYCSGLFTSFIYMLVCITWGIKLFGNYKGIEKKEADKKLISSVDNDYKYLDKIIRVILYLIVLIPLFILLITSIILFIISGYLVYTGVDIIGVPITFIGIIMLLLSIIKLFKDGLNNKENGKVYKLYISSFVFIFGCIFTCYNFSNFKTPDSLLKSDIVNVTESIDLKLDDVNTMVVVRNGDYELVTDNTLQENNIRVEATYYDDYVDILYGQEKMGEINILKLKSIPDEKINFGNFIKTVHNDLKKGYFFNYSDVKKINVKIYANEEVIKKLEENK